MAIPSNSTLYTNRTLLRPGANRYELQSQQSVQIWVGIGFQKSWQPWALKAQPFWSRESWSGKSTIDCWRFLSSHPTSGDLECETLYCIRTEITDKAFPTPTSAHSETPIFWKYLSQLRLHNNQQVYGPSFRKLLVRLQISPCFVAAILSRLLEF